MFHLMGCQKQAMSDKTHAGTLQVGDCIIVSDTHVREYNKPLPQRIENCSAILYASLCKSDYNVRVAKIVIKVEEDYVILKDANGLSKLHHKHEVWVLPPIVNPLEPNKWTAKCRIIQADTSQLVFDAGETFDIAISSPPYNQCGATSMYGETYADSLPDMDYLDMLVNVCQKLSNVVNGPVIINMNYFDRNPSLPIEFASRVMNETPLKHVRQLTWLKQKAYPLQGSFTRLAENVFVFGKTLKTLAPLESDNDWWEPHGWTRITSNAFSTTQMCDQEKCRQMKAFGYTNRATFPIEFVGKLLATFAKPGDTVIDAFAGSGTVGEACAIAGMHFTGVDISSSACDWMRHRLGSGTDHVEDVHTVLLRRKRTTEEGAHPKRHRPAQSKKKPVQPGLGTLFTNFFTKYEKNPEKWGRWLIEESISFTTETDRERIIEQIMPYVQQEYDSAITKGQKRLYVEWFQLAELFVRVCDHWVEFKDTVAANRRCFGPAEWFWNEWKACRRLHLEKMP